MHKNHKCMVENTNVKYDCEHEHDCRLLALLMNAIGNVNVDCIKHDTSISLVFVYINVSVKAMATLIALPSQHLN